MANYKKPLGATGEFFRRRDEWRKHPMLTNQFRHATPGLGIALVAFGVYLIVYMHRRIGDFAFDCRIKDIVFDECVLSVDDCLVFHLIDMQVPKPWRLSIPLEGLSLLAGCVGDGFEAWACHLQCPFSGLVFSNKLLIHKAFEKLEVCEFNNIEIYYVVAIVILFLLLTGQVISSVKNHCC
ncbi:hypothetical protein F8388_017627 [Cannabis sativa]|uniref:Uncharacterized protein n=1 Tax=Cannabis sativa TaxID=3483 RepID=A0A7J6EQE4_CANSA|nr:hypothetical protein F8388_017627 [Cannabis sativa]KAF4403643.1 hypothetical protein G4B88_002496 [Cannabis sativa]